MGQSTQNIAQLVLVCRKHAGLTQFELAELAGVGKTVIFDIEQGKTSIQLDTLQKVLSILNIQMILKPPMTVSE